MGTDESDFARTSGTHFQPVMSRFIPDQSRKLKESEREKKRCRLPQNEELNEHRGRSRARPPAAGGSFSLSSFFFFFDSSAPNVNKSLTELRPGGQDWPVDAVDAVVAVAHGADGGGQSDV